MKRKTTLIMIALLTGFLFVFLSLGVAGTQQPLKQIQKQPTTPKKEIKPGQVPKEVVKLYKIVIEKFELTNECQVKLVLKNVGADLSTDQYKNSYLKVGNNPRVSLSRLGVNLRKKNKEGTYLDLKPIEKETTITAIVTLFNGTKTTLTKTLKPTCPKILREMKTGTIQKPQKKMGKKTISPEKEKSLPAFQKQGALKIKRAYVKENKIHVVLQNSGQGKLSLKDLANAKVEVRHGVKTELVSLKNKKAILRQLVTPGKEVDFNTGLELKKKGLVSAGVKGLKGQAPWRGQLSPKAISPGNDKHAKQMVKKESAISMPGRDKMFQPQPEPPGKPMKTMSGEGSVKIDQPTEMVKLPETILQVQRLGGDLETWDSYGATDTSLQKMKFQWKTQIESLHAARWQVSLSPDFPYVIANGSISPIPSKGKYGRFSVDLSSFSATYTKPVVFYLRVKPMKYNIGMISSNGSGNANVELEDYDPSLPVRITLTEAGSTEQTEFNLPETHLKVVFQEILLVDDSDDLSGGDLGFKFIVNGVEKIKNFADGKYDSGDMIPLSNISFLITKPPHVVGTAVLGCDRDEYDQPFQEDGKFASSCGDDPDTASITNDIFTGTKFGRWHIPYKPFALYATGGSLKFEVHGYYEMYCDPCP